MCPSVPPKSTPPPSPDNLFQTLSPALVSASIAARQLEYSHCTLHSNGPDVLFFFKAPHHLGDELLQKYAVGTFPLVDPHVFSDARSFLAKENLRLKEGAHVKK
jgi:hypothetical protein